MDSLHWTDDRRNRSVLIAKLGGEGKEIFRTIIDRGHPAGPEIHVVTDNAMIIIYNAYTFKKITVLIGRPSQVGRYGHAVPEVVMRKAKAHAYFKLSRIC